MNEIDQSLDGMANENLIYAETYLALSLLASSIASDMLEAKRNNNVLNAAETMKKLTDAYEEKAREFLKPCIIIHPP